MTNIYDAQGKLVHAESGKYKSAAELEDDIERYADTGAFTIDIADCRLDGTTAVATGTIVNDNPSREGRQCGGSTTS